MQIILSEDSKQYHSVVINTHRDSFDITGFYLGSHLSQVSSKW